MQVGRLGIGSAVAGGVLGVAAMVGVGVAATGVSAQTPGATPTATATAKADRAQIGADYLAKLAANLRVSVDALKAANVTTQNQLIDEAVTAGRLTAEQATQAKARVAEHAGTHLGPAFHGGKGGPGGHAGRGPGGPGGMPGARMGGDIMEPVTTLLGIDAATLRSELASGKSLAQVAEAHGKTREQLKQVLSAQFGAMIDKIIDQAHQAPMRPAAAPSATPRS